ncbi:50S ribosomal protein L24 [Candidatus Sumerlaeota bacterium]|nr:50S ribosomal protein L24 [Candidatus Sumerlaeales bacterium]NLD61060.1 50S ribosomal protein L24 [Candidatus Sumerlaeota bacterium]
MALRIKREDKVQVTTGKFKGQTGRVLFVHTDKGKAIVEGVNVVKRHTKQQRNQQGGGIVEKEAPIAISNLSLYCEKCKRGVRFGVKIDEDGKKVRFCKKCGAIL